MATIKQRFGHIEIPLQRVHMELTNVCDFNCVFCPKSEMKRKYGYMDTVMAKKIIDELRENNICEKVTLHVMGEPTLHPDFFEILSHAQDKGLKVGLTTNGGGLGGKTGKRLLDYDLHQVDISLQTPDERSFVLRKAGKLTFEEYLNGILQFFSSYHERHKETIFKFRFLNTRFRKKNMEKRIGPIKVISSAGELRDTFRYWAGRIYDMLGVERDKRDEAMKRIEKLVSYKWNVVEIYPNVFFETYMLEDWGHAFDDESVRDAWAGYCFGMRDHFAVLHNGDVALCCVDFDGRTKIGNLHESSLKEVLSSDEVGRIVEGFKRFKPVHPYCKRCLGSKSRTSWILKPIVSVLALKTLKPFFYSKTKLY
ncbi:MAG: radical SAM protein [Nitrospirae bacterium GWC2_46_6]|nr:MAG: radical SAM protein [Nitrospirae bacterium GWA2_46_11]OGW23483.1 MAG: radical SAM protein [Nitrospirae bacterium GWC2_46_6]OGW26086.1 MAG: radical SAM protein [Nitrospirae bacterium GWB2_47_37]HAK89461.1 radical SAM protein [Nitrospiraceae bacterium]HCL81931.1 radical SAM protein [Nitrospiraceae bacterium]